MNETVSVELCSFFCRDFKDLDNPYCSMIPKGQNSNR